MKYINILLISIILTSCSTIKIDEQIVGDFITEKKLKDFNDKNIYLVKEASSYINPLDYYEKAFSVKDLYPGEREFSSIPHKLESWPIKMEEIKILRLKNNEENSIKFWDEKNFKSFNIQLIEKKEIKSKLYKGKMPTGTEAYFISKPILSQDKKYTFLTFSSLYLGGGEDEKGYLMEKENGKWKIIASFYKNIYYQSVK